jgi:hypothetical protein
MPADGHYLTRKDLEVVIRRATELDAETSSTVPELSEADLIRIANEVGLSEDSVRRALAEHQAGAGIGLLAERGWASRLCGSGLVTTRRVIRRSAEETKEALESHFKTNESLRLVRRTQFSSLWEPDRGVVPSIIRSMDLFGRGYQLAKKGEAIEFSTLALREDSSEVSLTVDLGNNRAGWFWGLGVAAGGAIALGAAVAIAGTPGVPDALAAVAPAAFAATIGLARVAYRRAAERMRLVLDGLLDRLEHGEPLEPPRPSWRDLLK